MTVAAGRKSKIKDVVEKEACLKVSVSKKRRLGWRLVRGEAAGKLAVRTDDQWIVSTKSEAMKIVNSTGKAVKQELDDTSEGCNMTAELWKVERNNDETFYWFIERI